MTSAIWAYGSQLKLGDGAVSESFTAIAEITELTPPNESRDDIEVSNMSSSNGTREFISGWRDGGEVTFKANWLPTNSTQDKTTGLRATYNDNLNHNWQIVLPGSVLTISFAGHLSTLESELPLDGAATLSGKIKVSGEITYSV
jgi:predicted secreted protein